MRIISGRARGHNIKAPKGLMTRPTLDRVRESIFNVLANYGLYDTTVLDFFSGTGALALEALSRGALHAVAVDKQTAKLIKENAEICHLDNRITILPMLIQQSVRKLKGQQFDFIFSDPPYEKNLIAETIKLVVAYDLLKDNGILILEHHEKEQVVLPEAWECFRMKKFGYTCVSYCRKQCLEGAN